MTCPRWRAVAAALALGTAVAAAADPGDTPGDDPPLPHPVICLHGFRGDASTFEPIIAPLTAAGLAPIPLEFAPADGDMGLAATAEEVVSHRVDAELSARGYPDGQRFSVLAHSLGGLVARHLIENGGWTDRVDRVALLAVPNHGARTGLGQAACGLPPSDPWRQAGCDTRNGSEFLVALGTHPPQELTARYLSVGSAWRGSPMPGGGDMDGSGQGHSNDGVVSAESPYLDGVPLRIWEGRGPSMHTRLFCNGVITGWIVDFLVDGTLPELDTDPQFQVAPDLCYDPGGAEGEVRPGGDEVAPAPADAALITFRVDAGGAADPLVQFKLRQGRLHLRLDDRDAVTLEQWKVPRGEPVHAEPLAPGEHVLEVRWDVVFRSATDRHHPAGTRPDEIGFSVPDEGNARLVFEVEPERSQEIWIRLFRKAGVGSQGRGWVEFDRSGS